MTFLDQPDPDENLSEDELNSLFEVGMSVDVHFGMSSRVFAYVGGTALLIPSLNQGGGGTLQPHVAVAVSASVEAVPVGTERAQLPVTPAIAPA